jgi:diphosphomevalonate decarboxylase
MTPKTTVDKILSNQPRQPASAHAVGSAFAPSNIALCKYWGKRNDQLNLPVTNSLSISLGNLGATTRIWEVEGTEDRVSVNGQVLSIEVEFHKRLSAFLNLFRPQSHTRYCIETTVNIPIAAGLASSACGFAALVRALQDLYQWNLSNSDLSVLARLGSGSACRSLWEGFVEWERGEQEDGFDSKGVVLDTLWPELRMGLLMVDEKQKTISSRMAMKQTVETSLFYCQWPSQVNRDLLNIKKAIQSKDFPLLGETAESNAEAMHALMMTAQPSIQYTTPETLKFKTQIWDYRKDNRASVYFTQDAGPNLKLLFLSQDESFLQEQFPNLQVIVPFQKISSQLGSKS